jgi:hypothetical protein
MPPLSDDMDDLELQALQRQLDDAFETTRPRRGYEDELWLKLQARRPFWSRVRDFLAGIPGAIRELPAVPAATVAVVLILAVGVGAIALGGGLRPTGHTLSENAGAPQPADLGAQDRLPTPALHPGLVDGVPASDGFAQNAPTASAAASNVYYGPATLSWTGTFATSAVQAPVLTYAEPGLPEADQFAASLGASSNKQLHQVAGFVGTYAGQDFVVGVRGTIPQLPREPFFFLTPSNQTASPDSSPLVVANLFLSKYSLMPTWPNAVTVVQQSPTQARVLFTRQYELSGGTLADFVDWNGDKYGIEVDVSGGKAVLAFGQLPISLPAAGYRLISNDAALRAALSAGPAGPAVLIPTPVVHLDQAVLVYALAVAGGKGYFEPAYLFSGSFQYNGQTYVKRVLVPLVDPSLRSS